MVNTARHHFNLHKIRVGIKHAGDINASEQSAKTEALTGNHMIYIVGSGY